MWTNTMALPHSNKELVYPLRKINPLAIISSKNEISICYKFKTLQTFLSWPKKKWQIKVGS